MNFRNMIGWFGILLAGACVLVGLMALASAAGFGGAEEQSRIGDALVVLAAVSFLKPVGLAAMAAGTVGLFWPPDSDGRGHKLRCWIALAIGAASAATSMLLAGSI